MSPTPGIYKLCQAYGVVFNPTKIEMKRKLWTMDKKMAFADPLPEDLALYAAWDVEPLHGEHEFHWYLLGANCTVT